MAQRIQMPNFLAECPFPLHISPHCAPVSMASDKWLARAAGIAPVPRGTKAGLLAAACFARTEPARLRVCCDVLNLLCYVRSLADAADECGVAALASSVMRAVHQPQVPPETGAAALTCSVWARLQKTCPIGVQRRLADAIESMLIGLERQAQDRVSGAVPDIEECMDLRRETGAMRVAFVLIEYAYGLRLPRDVCAHPVLVNLTRLAADLVAWSSDVLAYNADQARGRAHNLVAVVMRTRGASAQGAVNYVHALHRATLVLFADHAADLPSWCVRVDAEVAAYVRGLHDCVAGMLHWAFETERYFGDQGAHVRVRRVVVLDPPQQR